MKTLDRTIRHPSVRIAALALAVHLPSLPPASALPLPAIGLSAHGAELLVEEISAQTGPANADRFGHAVAAGDFNHDGADDLAIGIPFEECPNGTAADCGAVSVRWGSPGAGLGTGSTRLTQTTTGTGNVASAGEAYGFALAAGDFNGDGRDDLAVGVPGDEDASGIGLPIGGVQLHFGSSSGFSGGRLFEPSTVGHPFNWGYARFGHALAFGDFNGDQIDDLAVGAWNDGCGYPTCSPSLENVGSVTVYEGNSEGATLSFDMMLGFDGLPDSAEDVDEFGYALATADFNGDGYDDLAIGVPGEDGVGAALVVYGSQWSLLFAVHEYIGQWDLNQTTQPGSRFAEVLSAGDFDDDGFGDLAIGIPSYDGNAQLMDMGLVPVVYGSAAGLLGSGRLQWLWEDLLFGSGSGSNELFGSSLAAGDFNADGVDDLAIGVERESANQGAGVVVLGSRNQGLFGARRVLERGDYPEGMIQDDQLGFALYGAAVATGDFDGNGFDDLALAAPGRQRIVGPLTFWEAGAVAVVYGQLFIDGFETRNTGEWSAAVD